MATRSALLAATLLVSGCSDSGDGPGPDERRAHVVLVLIDTLRADRLGVYGAEGEASPHIDALAAECVVFEAASAPAPWTLPSVVSLMTSTFLPEHRVARDGNRIAADVPTLASRLRNAGYATHSVFGNPYAGPLSGLDRGFDSHELAPGPVDVRVLEAWLATDPPAPFFLYLHNTVPHDPYDPGPVHLAPFGEVSPEVQAEIHELQKEFRMLSRRNNLRRRVPDTVDNSPAQTASMQRLDELKTEIEALYAGDVHRVDEEIGAIVRVLKERGMWEDTLFVLLSDHGEELGDHGGWEHDQSVYEELVHVPLLVHLPGGAFAGTRVTEPVSLVDVAPTVLEAVGASSEAGFRGRSLLPLVRGEGAGEGARVTAYRYNVKKLYTPWQAARGDENVVVRDGRWKAIWNVELDTLELYDLERDPDERDDRSAAEPELAERLRAFADEERGELLRAGEALLVEEPAELSPEARAQLRALGYLSEDE